MQQPMMHPSVAAEVRRRIPFVARTLRLLTSAATLLTLLPLPCPAQHSTNSAAEAKLKQLQVAPGLKVELVAAEPMLQNPVAFSVDERGRFFIAETHRWKSAVFDITQRVPWLLDDLSCRTVADREALLRRHFPGTNFSVLTNHSEVIRLVEDTDGDGRADKSTVIADGFNSAVSGPAAGILARNGEVWLANLPDLWRVSGFGFGVSSPAPLPPGASPANSKPKTPNPKQLLASGLGVHISVSGHDLHGLTFGPDGRLYFSLGDRGFELRPGMKHPGFSAEYLRRIAPDTGAVFRCQPDGSELEVFCIGLRNPQGLAFDALGNLFTVDNDTAGPDKARLLHLVEGGDYGWRISYQHMKNFGPWVTEELWRGGHGDILPWSGEVAQGPAGFAFYPGTGLPDRYTNHFFICDFPGGIWSFSLRPRGASFELAAREKFLWNLLPTHAAFGPDGALYVSDWVEGWGQPEKGRLYRVSSESSAVSRNASWTLSELHTRLDRLISSPVHQRAAGAPSWEDWRQERFEDLVLFTDWLAHSDHRVRQEAQWALELGGGMAIKGNVPFEWWNRVTTPQSPEAQMHHARVRVSEMRTFEKQVFGRGSTSIHRRQKGYMTELTGMLAAQSGTVRSIALPLAAHYQLERDVFNRLLDTHPAVRFAAAQACADMKHSPNVQSRLRGFLKGSADADPYLTHAGMMALLGIGDFDAIQRAARDESPAVRRAAMLCMQRLLRTEIAQFLRDPDPRLVLEAARAINDAGISPAYPALAALLPVAAEVRRRTESALSSTNPPPHVGGYEAILRRALNAHYRLGHATNAQALAEFAAGEVGRAVLSAPPGGQGTDRPTDDTLRAEALFLLSAWEIQPATPGNVPAKIARVDGHGSTPLVNPENWPGWFDRVCGLWRPLPPRNATAARVALRPHLASLLNTTATNTQLAAIAAAEKLALTEAAPHLAALVKDTTQPAPARVASLRTLGQLARAVAPSIARQEPPSGRAMLGAPTSGLPSLLSESVTLALSDTDTSLRREAVKLAAAGNPTTAVPLLERMLTTEKDARLVQAALSALGDIPGTAADRALVRPLEQLKLDMWQRESELDLVEASTKRPPGPAADALKRYWDSRSKDDALTPFRPALVGGDATEGKRLFHEHPGAQCLRCHAVRGAGGTVGPDLAGVGKRLTREQLLESIVLPNRALTAGFENATLVLKSGANHSGLVKSETATELVLDSPEDGKLTLKKSDIEKRIRGLSAMPEGVDKLITRRELRDLVEYLAGLK